MPLMRERSVLGLLISLAFRTIWAHKAQSAIVGLIVSGSTFLLLLGTSLLHSVEQTMAQSVISSIAGHLQVYDKDAKDKLSLFGSGFIGLDDVGRIDNFEHIEHALTTIPEIKAVIPMGPLICSVHQESQLDKQLNLLKVAFEVGHLVEQEQLWQNIVLLLGYLVDDLERQKTIASDPDTLAKQIVSIAYFQTDPFWQLLQKNPDRYLLEVESIASPLWEEGRMLYLRNLGTDLDKFTKLFDRLQLLRGQYVPTGKRGILLSSRTAEQFLKHKVAKDLDAIEKEIARKDAKISNDPKLQDLARRLPKQAKSLLLQITPSDRSRLLDFLRVEFVDQPGDATKLLQTFLDVNDSNFRKRYQQFYTEIAPLIRLYAFDVGDTITLSSFSRTGYRRSANVTVYGIYQFQGLEDSDLAGTFNLLDMETFRELYGTITAANRSELAALKQEVGVKSLDRLNVEDTLFGEAEPVEVAQQAAKQLPGNSPAQAQVAQEEQGFAVHAAVLLHDPSKLPVVRQQVTNLIEQQQLPIQSLDWQEASGVIGQFIWVIRAVLTVSLAIVLLVALVIVNNAMVMATLKRIGEIGTMRAIGAQRWFVVQLVLFETMFLSLLAGAVGVLLGVVVLRYLGHVGIPAQNDIMTFLFSGKHLYPVYTWSDIVMSIIVVVVLAMISSLYPVRLALRVAPVVAMQSKE